MKLNYTSLQHAVAAGRGGSRAASRARSACRSRCSPCTASCRASRSRSRTAARHARRVRADGGGALPGALSDTVADLLQRGLLVGPRHRGRLLGGAARGDHGRGSAARRGAARSGWDCALVGPGPGILGSAPPSATAASRRCRTAHAALSLGCEVVLAPRLSSGDPRERHRGLSHHTGPCWRCCCARCAVAVPSRLSLPVRRRTRARDRAGTATTRACVDVSGLVEPYLASGLPADHDGPLARGGSRTSSLAALAGGRRAART